MKKLTILFLTAAMLACLFGCRRAEEPATQIPTTEAPTAETTEPPHEHIWTDGKCDSCGQLCAHEWSEGLCTRCLYTCAHKTHNSVTRGCTVCGVEIAHDFVDGACTHCSLIRSYTSRRLPEEYMEPCETPGTVEKIYYDTYAYGVAELNEIDYHELPVRKYAYVYLPVDYDPNTEYNILYLIHGTNGCPETWFGLEHDGIKPKPSDMYQYNLNMVDNLIASGDVNPAIIVTPTYYTFIDKESPYAWCSTVYSLDKPACRGFGMELPQLMEAVESRYSTFAHGDTSRESLRASRSHRAFAGLSQGSIITLQTALEQYLDLFGYLGNFSGAWTSVYEIQDALDNVFPEEEILFWYHGEGTADIANENHWTTYNFLIHNNKDRLSEGVNTVMVDKHGFGHSSPNWYVDLYNVMHLFFLG